MSIYDWAGFFSKLLGHKRNVGTGCWVSQRFMSEKPDASASELIRDLMLATNRVQAIEQLVIEAAEPLAGGDSLINFDTALLHLDQTREFWFDQMLLRWADLGRALSVQGGHRAFHRFVFVPSASDFRNLSAIDHARHANVVQLSLHIQLWFGAVCHIVPVPRSRLGELSSAWSSYMAKTRVMFRAPNYYMTSFHEIEVVKDPNQANHRIEDMAQELRRRTVATLAYTSDHFEKHRLRTAAWQNIRVLMAALYPRCLTPGCRSTRRTHVDHVFQIGPGADAYGGRANSCLLNLRQLCETCNLRRPKVAPDYDPYQRWFTEVVPDRYRTPDVFRILTERPPWLGGSFDVPWRKRLEAIF